MFITNNETKGSKPSQINLDGQSSEMYENSWKLEKLEITLLYSEPSLHGDLLSRLHLALDNTDIGQAVHDRNII